MQQTLVIIANWATYFLMLLFGLRFLLQASGANAGNIIVAWIIKTTDKICKPVRLILPSIRNFDLSSLLLAVVVATIGLVVEFYLKSGVVVLSPNILVAGLSSFLHNMIGFYQISLFIIIIASFVAQGVYHPALEVMNDLLEPLLGTVRSFMPKSDLPLDFSPLIVLLALSILSQILRGLTAALIS